MPAVLFSPHHITIFACSSIAVLGAAVRVAIRSAEMFLPCLMSPLARQLVMVMSSVLWSMRDPTLL